MRRMILLLPFLLVACAEAPVIPRTDIPAVVPVTETVQVPGSGDAADDPAIWVNADDPSASLVIGTDKDRGLNVYDLSGRLLHEQPDGRMNNVDLRSGFMLDGREIVLVAASNRSDRTLTVYELQTGTALLRRLVDIPSGFAEPYGMCLYHSHVTGEFHAFVNDKSGLMRQWRLQGDGNGIVAEQVREFDVGSQPEGCVADDEAANLYVGEEAVGVWKYGAEPDAGDARDSVDLVGNGNLVADVEGMTLYTRPDGSGGYLIVSSQGDYSYAVYERSGNNAWLGNFRIIADDTIDGAEETDGIDVVSANLGADYPRGLLVVQDGFNTQPDANQNFKYVSFGDVIDTLSRR